VTTIPTVLEPQRYADIEGVSEKVQTSATVVKMRTRFNGETRMKFVYVPADGMCRRVTGGPVLPGPYAAFVPLATSITNTPEVSGTYAERKANLAAGLEFDVVEGDVLVIDGQEFTIVDQARFDYPALVPVEQDIPDSDLQAMEEADELIAEVKRQGAAGAVEPIAYTPPPKPKRVAIEDIEVGMPATHFVGSDSYAVEVYDVERFKSGAKAGQVKAVITGSRREDGTWQQKQTYVDGEFVLVDDTDRFLPVKDQPERLCTRTEGKVAWWSSLAVGYAKDYRDPSY
jgi:hypothetical protein